MQRKSSTNTSMYPSVRCDGREGSRLVGTAVEIGMALGSCDGVAAVDVCSCNGVVGRLNDVCVTLQLAGDSKLYWIVEDGTAFC